MRALILIALAGLAGCQHPISDAQEARLADEDDLRCQVYGAKPYTNSYILCRSQQDIKRAIEGVETAIERPHKIHAVKTVAKVALH